VIKVVVIENGRVIDRIRFDADTLVADAGDVAAMHRGVMRDFGASEDIWQRVAHAAGYLASARAFSHASRRLENLALAQSSRAVPLTCQIGRMAHLEPPIEIDDQDHLSPAARRGRVRGRLSCPLRDARLRSGRFCPAFSPDLDSISPTAATLILSAPRFFHAWT